MMLEAFVATLVALSPIKTVAHVDLIDADHALVIYTDTSAVCAPLVAFTPRGELRAGFPYTVIEPPTSDELVTRWTDARGLQREVRTNCATLKAVDCVVQHTKMVDLMLQAAPAQKPLDK